MLKQQTLLREAHEAEEKARIEAEKEAIAEHKRKMAEMRANFEKKFKHVWATGPVGVSKFHLTVSNEQKGEKLISALFAKTLIADVE